MPVLDHMSPETAERLAKVLGQEISDLMAARLRDLHRLDGYCENCCKQLALAAFGTVLGEYARTLLGPADGAVYVAEVAAMVADTTTH